MLQMAREDRSIAEARIDAAVEIINHCRYFCDDFEREPYPALREALKILTDITGKGNRECANCDGEGINSEGYCPQGNFTGDGQCLTPSEREVDDGRQ